MDFVTALQAQLALDLALQAGVALDAAVEAAVTSSGAADPKVAAGLIADAWVTYREAVATSVTQLSAGAESAGTTSVVLSNGAFRIGR